MRAARNWYRTREPPRAGTDKGSESYQPPPVEPLGKIPQLLADSPTAIKMEGEQPTVLHQSSIADPKTRLVLGSPHFKLDSIFFFLFFPC